MTHFLRIVPNTDSVFFTFAEWRDLKWKQTSFVVSLLPHIPSALCFKAHSHIPHWLSTNTHRCIQNTATLYLKNPMGEHDAKQTFNELPKPKNILSNWLTQTLRYLRGVVEVFALLCTRSLSRADWAQGILRLTLIWSMIHRCCYRYCICYKTKSQTSKVQA